MADDDKTQTASDPAAAASSAAKTGDETGATSPSTGDDKTGKVRFDQDPQIQDYIKRQVDARWQDYLHMQAQFQAQAQQPKKENLIELYEKEITDTGVDPRVAKNLVAVMARMAEAHTRSVLDPLKQDVQSLSINDKLILFASEHKDFEQHRKTMLEIYKNLSLEEQNFISNSPNGVDFLYSKAKLMNPQVSTNRDSTNSTPTRAGVKVQEGGDPWRKKAADALAKGDKQAYREAMANVS